MAAVYTQASSQMSAIAALGLIKRVYLTRRPSTPAASDLRQIPISASSSFSGFQLLIDPGLFVLGDWLRNKLLTKASRRTNNGPSLVPPAGVICVSRVITPILENVTFLLVFWSTTVPTANIHWHFNENSAWIWNMTRENLFIQHRLAGGDTKTC